MGTPAALAGLAFELFASLLAPPRCAACENAVGRLAVFCPACAATVEPAAPSPDGLCAFVYGGAVAQAITRMKYEGRPDLARGLGDLLFRAIAPHAGELRGALVVPVPLHPSRLAERGFNQSALVARRVARGLRAPLLPLALARVRDTPRQATLGREARLGNVAGSFVLRQASRVRGRDVVLVDDVHTTGATLGTCAQTLLEGGAARVTTAVVARA